MLFFLLLLEHEIKLVIQVQYLPAPPPSPPKPKAPEPADLHKELLTKKFQIQQKTSVKKLCHHYKFLLKYNDFATDATLKPPYSYAALICLAFASTR